LLTNDVSDAPNNDMRTWIGDIPTARRSGTNDWTDVCDPNHDPTGAGHSAAEDRCGVETNAIPDWVLLDMCTLTNATSVAGKININARFTGGAAWLSTRHAPLQTLFLNIAPVSTNFVSLNPGATGLMRIQATDPPPHYYVHWAASNVVVRRFPTLSPYQKLPAYYTPGEICEVLGPTASFRNTAAGAMAQPGDGDRAFTLCRIANLVTTRSDYFTVWVIAEFVEDLDRDGIFDWTTDCKYKYWAYDAAPPQAVNPTAWSNALDNAGLSATWNERYDGDGGPEPAGGSSYTMDRLRGRLRIQAVVQRYLDGGSVRYRVVYTRLVPM
jgi:hypothetical protein